MILAHSRLTIRINNRLSLTYGLRWQALPAFVSDLGNLTAFDIRNGGIIIPVGNQPRPGFLATINSCNPADPNNPADPCGTPTPLDTSLGCVPVLGADPNMPCAPVEYANKAGLGATNTVCRHGTEKTRLKP